MVIGVETFTPGPPVAPQLPLPPCPPLPPLPIIIPLFINFPPLGNDPSIVKAGILVEVDNITVDALIVTST
jgi:hypothetical protein